MSKANVLKELKKALKELNHAKEIYKKVDKLTEQALEYNFKGNKEIELIDNFAHENKLWKSSAVTRFNYKLKKVA